MPEGCLSLERWADDLHVVFFCQRLGLGNVCLCIGDVEVYRFVEEFLEACRRINDEELGRFLLHSGERVRCAFRDEDECAGFCDEGLYANWEFYLALYDVKPLIFDQVNVLGRAVAFEMDFRHRIGTAGVFARNLVNDFVAGNQNHLALVGYSR